jgi:hypothetical protein
MSHHGSFGEAGGTGCEHDVCGVCSRDVARQHQRLRSEYWSSDWRNSGGVCRQDDSRRVPAQASAAFAVVEVSASNSVGWQVARILRSRSTGLSGSRTA